MDNEKPLPTVPFGDITISRLIIGGNPFRGNSHWSPEMSRDMEGYYTVARVKETLRHAESHGINTVQARGDALIQACLREYWAEGGTIQFIVQTASELRDLRGHVRQLAAFGAKGIYIHGTWTDNQYLSGNTREIEELLKAIRDMGVQAGLGTHIPEVIDLAEEKDWDVDFYMTCMYNISVDRRESAVVSGVAAIEHFDHGDKFAMLERVRATTKTCLAFKVLGASRLCASPQQVKDAFAAILSGIKPCDAIVVGMFQKYRDQIAENAQIVRDYVRESREF
ncbi:MAG: hypothetical protein HZB26_23880 [Candidatus Hydrogenedentes bacterium]|nr:hypothetical protein [Candidatus Hydrogenedentota bacterium]